MQLSTAISTREPADPSTPGAFGKSKSAARHVLQCAASAAIVGAVVTLSGQMPRVNLTTVALVLVLVILGIAMRWGLVEAVAAAISGSLALDYFVPPSYGFGIGDPAHWVAYFTFLATALATGHLAARANRHRAEAVQRRIEMEKLHRLTEALSKCDSEAAMAQGLAGWLIQIFGAQATAVYNQAIGRYWRSGTSGDEIDEEQLSDAGAGISSGLLMEATDVIGIAVARARAAETAKEGEIARRSAELKSAIFDAMAHEARGPLGSINIAATTLLSNHPGDAAQQREMLEIIKEEVERMNQWIDEAARTGRTDARRLTMHHDPQDIRDLVSRALDPPHPLLRGRQVAVRIENAIPKADCDAATTRRILKLLLDNALKYSPSGSPITISSNLDCGAISISVSDLGSGVPADEQPRIFEEHYRGSHHSSVSGTGLGLASAKKLVEWQGGQIWVTNRPEGGAAFHFSLPVANGATL